MPSLRSLSLLALLFATAVPAHAQDEMSEPATAASWRENAVARCVEQFSAEQCSDADFLEQEFHIESLAVAHRASTRQQRLERAALRELTLQHACNRPLATTCGGAADPALCATQIRQQCSSLAQQAANCQRNIATQCAGSGSACVKQRAALCPSLRKQKVEVVLAKYPKLKPPQKATLTRAANQLEAQTGWFGDLLAWVGL